MAARHSNNYSSLFHDAIRRPAIAPRPLPACVSTRPHRARKGQPIRTDLTAPLLTLANYLSTYLIRLLPHSSAPLPSLSLSPNRLRSPGVNPNSNPNPLLLVLFCCVNLCFVVFCCVLLCFVNLSQMNKLKKNTKFFFQKTKT